MSVRDRVRRLGAVFDNVSLACSARNRNVQRPPATFLHSLPNVPNAPKYLPSSGCAQFCAHPGWNVPTTPYPPKDAHNGSRSRSASTLTMRLGYSPHNRTGPTASETFGAFSTKLAATGVNLFFLARPFITRN